MTEHTSLDSAIHHAILAHVIDRGRAPRLDELASLVQCTEDEALASLHRLRDNHALVLHANERDVWVIHPFALWPTGFWVTSGRGGWWGNCAWCSLGIAALLDEDVTITALLGGEHEQVQLHVRDGQVIESDLLVHFPIPVSRAWDNVLYFCGTTLLFDSETRIDRWCERHGIAKGQVVPIAQAWALARAWYGQHLSPTWRKWTAAEASAIFEKAGLLGPFWEVARTSDRF